MESFLEKNKQENSHYGTVEFLHQDATQLTFEANRYSSNSITVIYLFIFCLVLISSLAIGYLCIFPMKKLNNFYKKV
jgi:hypothetical protein